MFLICFLYSLQRRDKVIQYLCRYHYPVTVRTYFLSYPYYPPSRITFQINEKSLAISDNLFRAYNIIFHCRIAVWVVLHRKTESTTIPIICQLLFP